MRSQTAKDFRIQISKSTNNFFVLNVRNCRTRSLIQTYRINQCNFIIYRCVTFRRLHGKQKETPANPRNLIKQHKFTKGPDIGLNLRAVVYKIQKRKCEPFHEKTNIMDSAYKDFMAR